jgi:hypothetical protein
MFTLLDNSVCPARWYWGIRPRELERFNWLAVGRE